jgi:hypothetical protein
MSTVLNPDVVRAEIARYWNLFTSKAGAIQDEFYAHECSIFPFRSLRPEPARLAAARREREYSGAGAALKVQVGFVDVVMVNETTAVACYTFEFYAEKFAKAGQGVTNYHYEHGRATQVFAYDREGRLRIFHEHFSIPAGEAGQPTADSHPEKSQSAMGVRR